MGRLGLGIIATFVLAVSLHQSLGLAQTTAKDVEKNVKALLQSGLAKLDVVPRNEFETQAQVLLKTREKLEELEKRVAELEARATPRG